MSELGGQQGVLKRWVGIQYILVKWTNKDNTYHDKYEQPVNGVETAILVGTLVVIHAT